MFIWSDSLCKNLILMFWFWDKEYLVALYPYDSRADGDLSFQKGDVMQLLDQRLIFAIFDY